MTKKYKAFTNQNGVDKAPVYLLIYNSVALESRENIVVIEVANFDKLNTRDYK